MHQSKDKRTCLNCGEKFEGRSDKKFCSVYCKSNFHHEKNKNKEQTLYKKIDKQLKLNRRLLHNFNKAGKSTVSKNRLIAAGFNPNFFTHYYKTQQGKVYLFCYEYGFMKIFQNGKDKYLLVEWQDYMNKQLKT